MRAELLDHGLAGVMQEIGCLIPKAVTNSAVNRRLSRRRRLMGRANRCRLAAIDDNAANGYSAHAARALVGQASDWTCFSAKSACFPGDASA